MQQKMRTKQAAYRVGLSASTLEKLRVYGGGPRYAKLGRAVVYDVADLDAWVAQNSRISTSDASMAP
ncbi:MAG: helix-turn-helix domain-containing protein [Achromobacter sp.]|uniref:helix-turn-helix transcriptional regulator n=1 Tax=Achromobacter sp. TaxID=134375 RepID=UPI00258CF0DE|nr:DNA-binding protein [Achromobacter sp.]MCW0206021.1 helix-turn-helix domain-containing protein [Achromobacter sp.]